MEIKKNTVIIELQRNDLWKIGSILRKAIINDSRLKWIIIFKGESEHDFVSYIRSNHHQTYRYLEEIYGYLDRMDVLESLEEELIVLFHGQKNVDPITK